MTEQSLTVSCKELYEKMVLPAFKCGLTKKQIMKIATGFVSLKCDVQHLETRSRFGYFKGRPVDVAEIRKRSSDLQTFIRECLSDGQEGSGRRERKDIDS